MVAHYPIHALSLLIYDYRQESAEKETKTSYRNIIISNNYSLHEHRILCQNLLHSDHIATGCQLMDVCMHFGFYKEPKTFTCRLILCLKTTDTHTSNDSHCYIIIIVTGCDSVLDFLYINFKL